MNVAVAVVVSGAPGSGKTTLARLLADGMQLPHLNKDVATASLLRSGVSYEVANKQAFQLIYGTAQTWLSSSMSLVLDMTMYPEYAVGEVRSLLPHGMVINVHCRAMNSLARWETKIRRTCPRDAEAIIERGRPVQDIATEPLDFGCPRIEIDTTSSYAPTVDEVIREIENVHSGHVRSPQ